MREIGRAGQRRLLVVLVWVAVLAGLGCVVVSANAEIYWTNNGDTLGRASLNGTDVNQTFITGATNPAGVAVGPRPALPVLHRRVRRTPVNAGARESVTGADTVRRP
jgi:hypothetical protein